MPLGNISGVYTTIPVMLKGQRAVLLERFTVRDWHRHILRYRPQVSGLPPAGVQMVLDADIPPADLACIRSIGTGAAPLDPTTHRAFEERYAIPILLSYGATEFAGPVTAMTADLHAQWGKQKFGSVGRAIAGAQLRVIDPDTGQVLSPGQEGILEVTVPRMGPEWIRTSDIALIDEDGFMYHRGRADGAIMRGGFKILPETIERALLLHDAISAVAVLGLPDQRLGQVPAAAIQLKPGVERPEVADLEAHLRGHVYATHIPAALAHRRGAAAHTLAENRSAGGAPLVRRRCERAQLGREFRLGDALSAVDREACTGGEGCQIAHQVEHRPHDLRGITGALQRQSTLRVADEPLGTGPSLESRRCETAPASPCSRAPTARTPSRTWRSAH